MNWSATVLTLFPEMFPGPLGHSLPGAALRDGKWSFEARGIRDHAVDRHRSVDDTPYGGGAGMVMRSDIVDAALEASNTAGRPEIYLSPRGRRLDQAMAEELAAGDGVVLLCGRYEGLDERVIEARGMQEVSLGDFVLSGGEYAAMSLIDACVRLLPGVLGAAESLAEESFQTGLFGVPAIYASRCVAGQNGARCIAQRSPRTDSTLASDRGAESDPRTAGRPLVAVRRWTQRSEGFLMNIIEQLEAEQVEKLKGKRPVPEFGPGDTLRVNVKVVEGTRERVQAFEGVCIARRNSGVNSAFTVRKISYGEGVERVFPLYSPRIESIDVIRRGDVRRAKLYYLRGRRGKSARIAEKTTRRDVVVPVTGKAAPEPVVEPAAEAPASED